MITTYKDSSSFGRRSYRIEDGFIFVEGKSINGPAFKTRIDLCHIDTNYDQLQIRSPYFTYCALFACIGLVFGGIERLSWKADVSFVTYICGALAFVSIILGIYFFRRVSLVRFKNSSGVPILEVFDAGPMKSDFHSFISTLQIEIDKKKSGLNS